MPRPQRPTAAALKLERANHELAVQLVRVRDQLRTKERHVVGLEILLHQRLEQIDRLTVQIDRLREQNRRLDQEHIGDQLSTNARLTKFTPIQICWDVENVQGR